MKKLRFLSAILLSLLLVAATSACRAEAPTWLDTVTYTTLGQIEAVLGEAPKNLDSDYGYEKIYPDAKFAGIVGFYVVYAHRSYDINNATVTSKIFQINRGGDGSTVGQCLEAGKRDHPIILNRLKELYGEPKIIEATADIYPDSIYEWNITSSAGTPMKVVYVNYAAIPITTDLSAIASNGVCHSITWESPGVYQLCLP